MKYNNNNNNNNNNKKKKNNIPQIITIHDCVLTSHITSHLRYNPTAAFFLDRVHLQSWISRTNLNLRKIVNSNSRRVPPCVL